MQAVIHDNSKIFAVIKNLKNYTENSFFGETSAIESINENLSVIFIENESLEIIYGKENEEENTDINTLFPIDIKPQKDFDSCKNQALQQLEILFAEKLNTPVNLNGIEVKPAYRDLYLDMYNTLKEGFMSAYSVKTADGQLISVHLQEMTALIQAIAPIVDAIYSGKHISEALIYSASGTESIENILNNYKNNVV